VVFTADTKLNLAQKSAAYIQAPPVDITSHSELQDHLMIPHPSPCATGAIFQVSNLPWQPRVQRNVGTTEPGAVQASI